MIQQAPERKTFRWLFMPVLVVVFLVLVIYAIEGIFPFGTESIVHDDMGQCNIPILYSVWDALHGNGSILLNLRTAGGVFVSGEFENALSPVNVLFFLLCPRDGLLESMSFFLLLKMALAACTAMLLFTRRFSLAPFWCTLLSVLYAFNPFLLQYYSNASWLEIVWVAPLVLLGADELMRDRRPVLYTLSLAYCLIVQLYIAFMVVLFLFLEGAVYILLLLPKSARKSAAIRFGSSTVLALLLSAFSALPSFFYMTSSSRFQTTKSYFQVLLSTASNPAAKFGMAVVLTAFLFALAFLAFLKIRKQTKPVLFLMFSLLVFVLPFFFENINLMWHMGSYVGFSMRYAFLLQLMLLVTAAYTLEQFSDSLFSANTPGRILTTVGGFVLFALAATLASDFFTGSETTFMPKSRVPIVAAAFVALFGAYVLLLRFGFRRLSCAMISLMILSECLFFFNHSVMTGSKRAFEYSLDYIHECNTIQKELPLSRTEYAHIKNIDGTLNTNYPLIADYPSMSNFTHTIPSTIKKSMQKLGYSSVYTRILDTGGTLFTDAFLGYRYALSIDPLPAADYREIGTAGSYRVYENRYAAGFGTVCDASITEEDIFTPYAFHTANRIWKSVMPQEGDLMEIPDVEKEESKFSVTYDFDVHGSRELYLVCSGSAKRKNMRITVNGKPVPVPSLGESGNMRYTTRFNNSILQVGEYADTHVTVRVELLNDTISAEKLQTRIALMDKDKLSTFAAAAAAGDVHVEAEGRTVLASAKSDTSGQVLFLPITYDSGWKCSVNGQAVRPTKALGTFMAVPLEPGQNSIRLTYLPKGFAPGAAISAAALILCVLWFIFGEKATHNLQKKKIASVVLVGYYAADAGLFAAIYLLPILFRLYTLAGGS